MLFADIPGLQELKSRIASSYHRGAVAHAQLFSGYPGGGQLAMALAYASMLSCEQPGREDACGSCASCHKNSRFIHPDVHFVFPVSPVREISGKDAVSDSFLREWREFLLQNPFAGPAEWSSAFGGEDKQLNISREESRNIIRSLSLTAFESRYKIMIVWLPEYLHPSAANALLKILEEPAPGTVFLLVTNQQEQLMGTILSRMQILKIRPFKDDEISDYINRVEELPAEKRAQAVQMANGNLFEALRLCRDEEPEQAIDFTTWMRSCYSADYGQLIDFCDRFGRHSKLEQRNLLIFGLTMARESLIAMHKAEGLHRIVARDLQFARNFAATLSHAGIELLYSLLNKALYHLERNANPKILFLDTSLAISEVLGPKKVHK